jgi:hypothetical protein
MGIKKIPERGRFCSPLPPVPAGRRPSGRNGLLPEFKQLRNTKEIVMKRSNIAKTFTIAAIAALAVAIAPAAKADDKGCSNATLRGTFALKGTGSGIGPTTVALLDNVLAQTFDGNGAVTAAGIRSFNGNINSVTQTGTYTVNPDCTGTYAVLVFPGGNTAHYFFVIDESGNELQIICTDSGVVFSAIARRQFPVGDWRQ